MSRKTREWHENFLEYMEFIIKHPAYRGLAITKKQDGTWSWFGTKKTKIGQDRIKWCEEKAKELGYPIQPGVYAEVMREIHPTKLKVCQTCGEEMSIYYHYPGANLLKSLEKEFQLTFKETDHISDIWDTLLLNGFSNFDISKFLIEKSGLDLKPEKISKEQLIEEIELLCRIKGKRLLSPGAMSNFPDRFDGFHTYNRCCRSVQDKGRSKENLKSYTRDRRAYEYWSDGNIHAANQFMGSKYFYNVSADHIGPISLGFIHDPRYIQPMDSSDNSAKRDRLQVEDVELLIEIENQTEISPISWYSLSIWEYIKNNYKQNPNKVATIYRNALKQNMSNFMYVIWHILENCSKDGQNFIEKALLKENYKTFNFDYTFNSKGDIIKETPRNFTERSKNETDRYKRIAIDSIYEYMEKDNRNINPHLTKEEYLELDILCKSISNSDSFESSYAKLNQLIQNIQNRLIMTL